MPSRVRQFYDRQSCSNGFTTVELIVAGFISVIVLGMVSMILMSVWHGTSKSQAGEKAAREARALSALLSNDTRAASSPDRFLVDDELEMRDLVAIATPSPDIRDVLVAGPNQLVLRTKARADGAAQCVTWARGSDGVVVRSVRTDWRTCAGNPVRSEKVATISPTRTPQLFEYSVLVDTNTSSDDQASCHAVRTSDASNSLSRIIAIGARVRTVGAANGQSRNQSSTDLTTIRARDERDFRYALGCAR